MGSVVVGRFCFLAAVAVQDCAEIDYAEAHRTGPVLHMDAADQLWDWDWGGRTATIPTDLRRGQESESIVRER
jgi:hypothetical protein